MQTVFHVDVSLEYVRSRWHGDAWFSAELLRQCGRAFPADAAVDCTPGGIGGEGTARCVWLAFGASARMGLLPVSDGTDIVLQMTTTLAQGLWERLFHSSGRRLQHFAAGVKVRLEPALNSTL